MAALYSAPKGTVDLLGQAALGWDFLQGTAAQVFSRYGYESVYTPLFEQTEVFARGIGEATDVVGKEMYTFEDRGGRSLTLRPENTAGVVRAAIDAHLTDNGAAVKLYYAGPMFRYERPQKGRQRQFYQIGAEALGFATPATDAEMILMLLDYFTSLGLPASSMTLLLNSMGDSVCRPAYRDAVASYIHTHAKDLCSDCVRRSETNPLRTFDCKNESCQTVMADAPRIPDFLCEDCREHFNAVTDLLDARDVAYELRPSLVRGLDYYTRTVFEIQVRDGLGSQNAIGGGGRYDGLFEQLGGKPTPGIGFAVGAERTLLALEAVGRGVGKRPTCDIYVAAADEKQRTDVFALTTDLRGAGQRALCDLQERSLKGQFKQADKAGARLVVVVGENEHARGGVTLRNMTTKEECFVPTHKIVDQIQEIL